MTVSPPSSRDGRSATSGMRVGLNLPHYGPETSPKVLRQFAQESEAIGLSSLWVIDRTLRPLGTVEIPLGMGSQMPSAYGNVLSGIETLVHVAGCTSTIGLGTSVVDCLFQAPAVLGRRLSTLDHISEGRLTVGLGQGYVPEEFAAVNVPMTRRGRGFDEFVAALRAVWSPDPVTFDGTYYQIPTSEIGPKPLQVGGPPLYMGAASVVGAQRAGRLGLGFNPVTYTWEALEEQISAYRQAGVEAGHQLENLPVIVRGMQQLDPTQFDMTGAPLAGSAAEMAEDVDRLMAMGVHEIFIDLTTGGFTLKQQLDMLPVLAGLQIA